VLEGRSADVRLFEIGTTFSGNSERNAAILEKTAIALAVTLPLKSSPQERRYHMADLAHQLFGVTYCCTSDSGLGGYGYDHQHGHPFRSSDHATEIKLINLLLSETNLEQKKLNAIVGVIIVHDISRLKYSSVTVSPLPRFPAIVRDLNLLVPVPPPMKEYREGNEHMPINRIASAVTAANAEFLESHHNLDRGFFGKGLPEGHFALAVRFVFRKPDGTLTTEEAEAGLEKIRAALAKIGVTVRGA
jgi:phenylalanyl-tRNA synthetase beta subunit